MSEPLDLDELEREITSTDWCPERECLSNFADMKTGQRYGCPHREAKAASAAPALIAEARAMRAALPDPAKLWALADWIDARFPDDADPEVQRDLRAWTRAIMALGLHPGIMAKEVLEDAALGGPER